MEIDTGSAPGIAPLGASSTAIIKASGEKKKPRFEIKKYNAVALWAWGRFLALPGLTGGHASLCCRPVSLSRVDRSF